jgi:hypothetical protein
MDKITLSTSPDELNLFLEKIRNLECWKVGKTAWYSLKLDFGDVYGMTIHTQRGDVELEIGEWRFESNFSELQLQHSGIVIYTVQKDQDVEVAQLEHLRPIAGSSVEKIEVSSDFRLKLVFSNGYQLFVSIEAFDDDEEWASWVIYNTEYSMVLEVNPGCWSYRHVANRRYDDKI